MTISVRQSSIGPDNAANYQATLASAPVAGNLLMAFICERSGATEGTVVESGWTRIVDHPQSSGDSTNRKYLAVAYKVAGASESSTVSWTLDNGSSVASAVGIVEFESDSGETFTFEDAVVTGSDATAASHSTGTTASIPATPQLLVGLCYTKVVTTSEHPYSDWSGGTDALTEFAQLDDGDNGRDISWAFANDTGTGTKSATAAVTAGSSAQRGAITTLAVFSVSAGGSSPNEGTASGAYDFAGTATGAKSPKGSGSGAYDFAGTSTGKRTPKGTASGAFNFAGSATGEAPTLANSGTASGAVDWAGSATGERTPKGSASGGYGFAGTSTGARTPKGSASGGYAFAGSASGEAPVDINSGTASGSYNFAGSATGSRTSSGTAAGTVSWTGSASGTGSDPLLAFTDDFNRADDVSLGANWLNNNGNWTLVSNQAKAKITDTTTSARVLYQDELSTNDQYAEVNIASLPSAGSFAGVILRGTDMGDPVNQTYYSAVAYGTGIVKIQRVHGLTITELWSGSVGKAYLRLEVEGSTLRLYTGVSPSLMFLRAGITDTVLPTGGWVGLRAFPVTTSAHVLLDNASLGDIDLLPHNGTASGSYSFSGIASGKHTANGTASGTYDFAGSASGVAPLVNVSEGTASGSWDFTGTAEGVRTPKGTASGGWSFAGTAVGDGLAIYTFSPPTYQRQVQPSRYGVVAPRYNLTESMSVVRRNGTLAVTKNPLNSELNDGVEGEDWFLGGHQYTVRGDLAEELIALGLDLTPA